jgi:hypothetical protein
VSAPCPQTFPHIPQLRGSSVHGGSPVSLTPVSRGGTPVSVTRESIPVSVGDGWSVATSITPSSGAVGASVVLSGTPVSTPLSAGGCGPAHPSINANSATHTTDGFVDFMVGRRGYRVSARCNRPTFLFEVPNDPSAIRAVEQAHGRH